MTALEQIKELSNRRQELWKQFEDSWVVEAQKYSMEEPKEIDILGEQILTLLQLHHKDLPVDFIIEELTKLGQAPSLLYDDNGHFAVTGDGYSTISDEPQDASVTCFIRKSQWKPTIREALEHYMFNHDEEISDNYVYDADDAHDYFSGEQLDILPEDFFEPEKED